MDLALILGVLKEGLKLWNSKEATKYLDKVVSLEKDYYEELAKNEDYRSQLALDSILLELEIIARTFAKGLGQK